MSIKPSHVVRFTVAIALFSSGSAISANWHNFRSYSYDVRDLDLDSVRYESSTSKKITYQIRFGQVVGLGNPSRERTVIADCQAKERLEIVDQSDSINREFKTVYPGTIYETELNLACREMEHPIPPAAAPLTPPNRQQQGTQEPQNGIPRERHISSTGGGFVVAKNMVVTNNHVVEGCPELHVRQGAYEGLATIRGSTERTDLALISTQSGLGSSAAIRQSAALGEDVMVAGHPLSGLLGTDLIVTGGQVNSLAGLRNDPTLLQISAPVQPGNSGGPLVDRSGDIVGVVVSKLNVEKMSKVTGDMAQNINFAIKPEVLRLFLDANQVPYTSARTSKRLEGAEIAHKARSFTVQVICYK